MREGRPADRLRLHVLPLVEGPLAGEVPYQLCVRELFPGRYLDYLACRMAGIVEADDSRSNDGCARLAGVDLEAIRRCMAGGEAERLLEAENRWIDASGVSSGSVPLTLVIDNRYVVGPAMLSAVDEVVRRVSAEGVGTDGG